MKVNFVDLKAQYQTIKTEVDAAIHGVLESCAFVNARPFEVDFAEADATERLLGLVSLEVRAGGSGGHESILKLVE